MDCRAVLAMMVDKRMKNATKVQEAPTKNGGIIRGRLGLRKIHNLCAAEGPIPLYLCGAKREAAVLKNGLRKVKGGRAKTLEL
jgi:hypothetical protein